MDRIKQILDDAKQTREKFEKDNGYAPNLAIIDWQTYEELSGGDICRTLCGVPLRVDPFCPKGAIIFLATIGE